MNDNKLMNLIYITFIVPIILFISLFILFFFSVNKVYAAETLNTWNGNQQKETCTNCTYLSFTKISGISTTNYFFTNQGTNVNWNFRHKITLKRLLSDSGVQNLETPTIRLYDGNNGYYDLTANEHCSGTVWGMTQRDTSMYTIKEYDVGYSCDISNFKVSFPSVSLFQVIYGVSSTTTYMTGSIEETSFITTETPYTTQNDYTGTINSVGGNIINNQNQNTTTITNNDNRNTDKIIENQNANSQATIDAIEKQNLKCDNYNLNNNNTTFKRDYRLYNNTLVSNTTYDTSDYIKISENKTYILDVGSSTSSSTQYCLYGSDKSLISCINYNNNRVLNITPTTNGYIRFSIAKNDLSNYSFAGEYCYNLLEKQNETNENIESALTDSSVSDPSSSLNGLNANIGTNSVISDLLLLPVTLYQSVLNNINGTCSAFVLGTMYGHQLKMPCLNISGVIGNAIYGVIDVLISGFFILSIRKKFVDIFNHFTSLKVGGNELE